MILINKKIKYFLHLTFIHRFCPIVISRHRDKWLLVNQTTSLDHSVADLQVQDMMLYT